VSWCPRRDRLCDLVVFCGVCDVPGRRGGLGWVPARSGGRRCGARGCSGLLALLRLA